MQLHGTLNHIAITVTDLDEALRFFHPLLQFFGYTPGQPAAYAGTRVAINVNEANGIGVNIWEAKKAHPFAVYEPGLHHIAINAGSKRQVDEAFEIASRHGAQILEGPAEFPFALHGYYAFYCLGPDGLKLEVVHMPELNSLHDQDTRSTPQSSS